MNEKQIEKRKLPALEQLYADVELAAKNNDLNIILNAEPKKEWIKDHPIIKGCKYMPIEKVEYLLTAIFIAHRTEVKNIQVIANSVVVTVTLHYINPIDGQWHCNDGVGAAPIQTNEGAAPTDFSKVKNFAVQQATPIAKVLAIKDAAEELGKIFGKDLNRKDVVNIQEALFNKKEGFENMKNALDKEVKNV